MGDSVRVRKECVGAIGMLIICLGLGLEAQSVHPPARNQPQPLITQPIVAAQRVILPGNTPPWARPVNDRGPAPVSLPLSRMILVFKRSPQQAEALKTFLEQVQDAASPEFHHWLTPQEFGAQFGLDPADIQTITTWLQAQGFQVNQVAQSRGYLEFSGTAQQVGRTFATAIHRYAVNNHFYWANTSDPSIPAALAPAVAGVVSLNSYRLQPQHVTVGRFQKALKSSQVWPISLNPQYTFNMNCDTPTGSSPCFALGPNDLATIYNALPLWNAGINGTGETIAIPGRIEVDTQSISSFRTIFDLPTLNLQTIVNGPDPGYPQSQQQTDDQNESYLDIEWAGALAPGAAEDFVISANTNASDGIDLSDAYIVDNDLAPILSLSYGECELGMGTAGNQFYNQLWQQAAAEGISVFVAAGDGGAAACDQGASQAQYGLMVNGTASPAYVTAVGGTDFNDLQDASTYWTGTNNSTTLASALSYIPETTWNDACTNAEFSLITGTTDASVNCNNSTLDKNLAVIGGGGGDSNCITSDGKTQASCSGGYAKPAWQLGGDTARDLPDVSLFAGNGLNNNFYLVCNGYCIPHDYFIGMGGTSASAPNWAGIQALVDQKMGGAQGDADYVLYHLNQQQTESACDSSSSPASSCIFQNVTSGTISQPCITGSPDCSTPPSGDAYGILSGYDAGAGYNLATGLGTPNIANLVNAWSNLSFTPSDSTLTLSPTTLTHGQAATVAISVTAQSGATGIPSGSVALVTSKGASAGAFTLDASGQASGTTDQLPGGTYNVSANYPGDGVFAPDVSPSVTVTVAPEPSMVTLAATANGTSSPFPSTQPYGSYVTLMAKVAGTSGVGTATGNVTFNDNGSALSTETLDLTGHAGGYAFYPAAGTHSLTAAYAGDNNFQATTSAADAFTITKAATDIAVLANNGSLYYNHTNVFSVNISTPSVISSGAADLNLPTGTYQFILNGNNIGNPQSINNITDINTLNWGPNTISAAYSGDANYQASTSATLTVYAVDPDTMQLTATSTNLQAGASDTLTATLTPQDSSGPAMTGNVAFNINGTVETVPVSGNTAQYTTQNIPAGSLVITANYTGDHYYASSYNGISITVVQPDFSINVNPYSGISIPAPGDSGTATIQTTSLNGFTGNITFTCSGLPALSACTFNPASVAAGSSTTLTITTTGPGNGLIAAPSAGGPGTPPGSDLWVVIFLILAGSIGLWLRRPSDRANRQRPHRLVLTCAMGLLLAASGCGGGNTSTPIPTLPPSATPSTPVGATLITVTGTSGSLTHQIQFFFSVG